jgi:hypothetical protein
MWKPATSIPSLVQARFICPMLIKVAVSPVGAVGGEAGVVAGVVALAVFDGEEDPAAFRANTR